MVCLKGAVVFELFEGLAERMLLGMLQRSYPKKEPTLWLAGQGTGKLNKRPCMK